MSNPGIPERLDGRGYPMPSNGWSCFHCGENFQTWGSAQDHFGATPKDTAACKIKVGEERGLVMEIRGLQSKLEQRTEEASHLGTRLAAAKARNRELQEEMQQLREQLAKAQQEIKTSDEIYEAQQQKYADCPHKPLNPDFNECGCSFDHIGDVCGRHSPALKAAQQELCELREQLANLNSKEKL